jgi:hypothetical protein
VYGRQGPPWVELTPASQARLGWWVLDTLQNRLWPPAPNSRTHSSTRPPPPPFELQQTAPAPASAWDPSSLLPPSNTVLRGASRAQVRVLDERVQATEMKVGTAAAVLQKLLPVAAAVQRLADVPLVDMVRSSPQRESWQCHECSLEGALPPVRHDAARWGCSPAPGGPDDEDVFWLQRPCAAVRVWHRIGWASRGRSLRSHGLRSPAQDGD